MYKNITGIRLTSSNMISTNRAEIRRKVADKTGLMTCPDGHGIAFERRAELSFMGYLKQTGFDGARLGSSSQSSSSHTDFSVCAAAVMSNSTSATGSVTASKRQEDYLNSLQSL
eukprot:750703-Hanusia_phi.AAC.1